jgi:branched-chain amino acid transport system ATP-binding protein
LAPEVERLIVGTDHQMRTILGNVRPRAGTIEFAGQRIDALPSHRIVRLGISPVPEGRRVFARMTVRENLEVGTFARPDRQVLADDLEQILTLFPVLAERADQPAGTLSGGEQQMLAMGRAMMACPKLICMDEPSMGLAPIVVEKVFDTIVQLAEGGSTILLIEQNAQMALSIADRGYILEAGQIVLHDTAARLLQNPLVLKAYLGESARAEATPPSASRCQITGPGGTERAVDVGADRIQHLHRLEAPA